MAPNRNAGNGGNIDWKMEEQFAKEDVAEVNGHRLGLMFYKGYNASNPDSPKTLRLLITEKDIHGKSKPYRIKNFETGKAENLQLVLPDNLVFAENIGKFLLEAVKNARDEMKANLEKIKSEAKAAGISLKEA